MKSHHGILRLSFCVLLILLSVIRPTKLFAADRFANTAQSALSTKWLVLLCKFSDDSSEPKPISYFQSLFGNTYPGLDHYWREVTYNLISLEGTTIFGWLTMPQPRSYFVSNPNTTDERLDHAKLLSSCGGLVDTQVNFNDYYGAVFFVNGSVNGPFGVEKWGLPVPFDGVNRRYFPLIWIDAKANYNMGLTAHEIAHGYGFAHSYYYGLGTDSGFRNPWDLTGGTCIYASNAQTLPCVPLHPVSAAKLSGRVNMIPPDKVLTVSPFAPVVRVNLERLAQPTTINPLVIKIPVVGYTDRYFTVEARMKAGYDSSENMPGSAVLIHEVWPSHYQDGPAQTYTGRGFPGDDGSMWLPGDVFSGTGGITVTVVSSTTTGFVVQIANNNNSLPFLPTDFIYLPLVLV